MRSSRPFLVRLILPFSVMMVIVVIACGAVIYWAGQQTVRRQQIRDLGRLVTLVRGWVGSGTDSVGPQLRRQLDEAARVLGTRITLIAGDGSVLLDSEADPAGMQNHNARAEVWRARRGEVGTEVRVSDTTHETHVYVARLLDADRPDGVVVRLSYPRRLWEQFAAPAWVVVAAGVFSALALIGWLSVMVHGRWIRPVTRLSEAAARMGAGEWHLRVRPEGAQELRQFSAQLNVLAGQAQQQLAELDSRRADLQALVDSLPDPILLTDAKRRIVLINEPAARLLQVPSAQALGERLVNVVNDEPIIELFEALLDPGVPESTGADTTPGQPREVRLLRGGQRVTYQAVLTRTRVGGVLLVLRDITALVGAVQMKTDFVANASHELRTPMAAIRIAFETLQEVYEEDPGQSSRCIAVLDAQLKRLEEMLNDLLDLSRVESPDLRPHLQQVNAGQVLAPLRNTLGPMARQKLVELVIGDPATDAAEFASDGRLLGLILKNLLENAIKFTPPGGRVTCSIGVNAESRPGRVVMTVSDTGLGIPPEHIDRVFERFYQVDPARSGSAGRGTGLGLAIVKHAVHALGGTVKLESEVGVGTTVTCDLPLVAIGAEVHVPPVPSGP